MTIRELIEKSSLWKPNKKPVIYRGVKNPAILFVGEAPGKQENLIGKPFVGRSGKMLDGWVAEFGFGDTFGITNIVPLIPLTVGDKIRAPRTPEMEYFAPFINHQIKKRNPKIIVCLGNTATVALLNKPIRECRGKLVTVGERSFTACYHPSYYLRRGETGMEDFRTVVEIINRICEIK